MFRGYHSEISNCLGVPTMSDRIVRVRRRRVGGQFPLSFAPDQTDPLTKVKMADRTGDGMD